MEAQAEHQVLAARRPRQALAEHPARTEQADLEEAQAEHQVRAEHPVQAVLQERAVLLAFLAELQVFRVLVARQARPEQAAPVGTQV